MKSQTTTPQLTIKSGLIVNEKTYIKYKIYHNFEQQIEDILSQKIFPKCEYQVSFFKQSLQNQLIMDYLEDGLSQIYYITLIKLMYMQF